MSKGNVWLMKEQGFGPKKSKRQTLPMKIKPSISSQIHASSLHRMAIAETWKLILQRMSDYDELPECVKQYYSEKEYLFMTDDQKANILRDNTDPEVIE